MSKKIAFIVTLLNAFNYTNTVAAAIQPRIIGGTNADATRWPWMTGIVLNNNSSNPIVYCGGSLIAKDWVLTSANCLNDVTAENLYAIINRPNLQSSQGEFIAVKEVVVHPQYNSNDLTNDIALLKLSQPSTITPVETLPNYSNQDQNGKMAIALGWGNTSATSFKLANDLQQVDLPIISNTTCNDALPGIVDSMLCAGYAAGGADSCDGDGGGPLMVMDDESQTWRQAGISSFGESTCAAPGFYGVYTRVDRFNDFISKTICSAEAIPPAPTLKVITNGTQVTASWTKSDVATGYRLFYAPYPSMSPIGSMDQHQAVSLSVNLPQGSAFYVAVNAYNGKCLSAYSSIEKFVIQF